MEIEIFTSIEDISHRQWENLAGNNQPFIRYEFLSALERNACVSQELGWITAHFALFDEQKKLVGVLPSYIKTNSYGELVFDWSWADAYQRTGLAYYPKLVTAIPYTPATGPRLLVKQNEHCESYKKALISAVLQFCHKQQFSSFHMLFPNQDDLEIARQMDMMPREGCQFHWYNREYSTFDDFLATMTSRKRKRVNRERRKVTESGVAIEILHGNEIDADNWQRLYPFYRDTFLTKGGIATLTQSFFEEISRTMGEQLVVVTASFEGDYVAASIFFRSDTVLYGRHWGCNKRFDSLHFELCYYQGIEYAIRHGLKSFEPGAQGEYKVSRGFEPTSTWSAHYIAEPGFRHAIEDFLKRERAYMKEYCESLREELPFRLEAHES
jgi:predicted N-acyltransferase